MSPRAGDRRRITGRQIGAAVLGAAMIAISIGVLSTIGGRADIPAPSDQIVRLDLQATRDLGALPPRDTWCSGADHCWVFQQSSGDATDYGDTGGWHLTPYLAGRAGIPAGLPVQGTTVEVTSEMAIGTSLGASFRNNSTTIDGTSFSITYVHTDAVRGTDERVYTQLAYGPTRGFQITATAASYFATTYGSSATKSVNWPRTRGWHCTTVSVDLVNASSTNVWQDGVAVVSGGDTSGAGPWSISTAALYITNNVSQITGLFARAKFSNGTIATLADHQADCGTLWQAPAGGVSDKKPLLADDTWTQTGGAVCYPTSTTTATCQPGGVPHYTVDATGLGWVTEGDQTNRVLYSTDIDCTNWTCRGTASATPLQVAPDGSATATEVTVGTGANDVYTNAAGYTASTALTNRLWVKCSTGTFRVANIAGAGIGSWTVDCSAIAGAWTRIYAAHAAVTVGSSFASGSGTVSYALVANSGTVTASIWAPTLTEESGTGLSVIPTGAAAVSTGDPVWAVANSLRNTGSQLISDGTMEATPIPAAWVAGNDAALSKSTDNPHGGTYALRVAYTSTSHPYASQGVLALGTIARCVGWARGDGTAKPRVFCGTGAPGWTGMSSTSWQAYDVVSVVAYANMILGAETTGAGWVEFDDVTAYEQESYGDYYRTGDTVTQTITPYSGTCWDPLTSTADLLLSGLEGTQCAGIWYGLEVRR